MSADSKYRVLPHEAKATPIPTADSLPLTDSEQKNAKNINGCLAAAIGVGVVILVSVASGNIGVGLVISLLVVGTLQVSIRLSSISDLARKKAAAEKQRAAHANDSEVRRVEGEAASLTTSLMWTYDTSLTTVAELPRHLENAGNLLRQAESEYQENAFAPFWDAVESAARHLAEFNDKTKQLTQNAAGYYRGLEGRKHTFPAFPIQSQTIPDATPVLTELRRVVRMGQTNFQFANIWEHRRTREVLIAGFRTLGEAVNNLGTTIEYSIQDLRHSVSSDLARVIEEQIKSRELVDQRMLEQNRMLDNIQSHRKPTTTDRPSKY
jgi:hypothetical protein